MAEFVPKSRLLVLLRRLIDGRESGLVSILTDTRRSVLLRFSEGKLTHSYCRSKDVGDAIQVLNECETLKFTFARASPERRLELIPTDSFLQLIDPGGPGPPAESLPPATPAGAVDRDTGPAEVEFRRTLTAVALDYIGVAAEIAIDEALENSSSIAQAIEYVAGLIPDPDQARSFRAAAAERLPDLSL